MVHMCDACLYLCLCVHMCKCSILWFFICLCFRKVYLCVWVHGYYTCIYSCVWIWEIKIKIYSTGAAETGILAGTFSFMIRLERMAKESQMSTVSAYPALGCNTPASLDVYMGAGDQTRSSCLYEKHFTDRSNFYFILCLLLYILRQVLNQLLRKALKLICSQGRPEISDYFE